MTLGTVAKTRCLNQSRSVERLFLLGEQMSGFVGALFSSQRYPADMQLMFEKGSQMTKHKNNSNQGKRLVLALAMGISAIGLTGCGDGGSGAAGVGSVGGSASAQVNFKVDNTSGYDIQSVQIVDKSGKELVKDKFSCEKDATCNFQAAMNQAGVLKFYDQQGALVGAYMLAQAPNPIQIVKPSAYMLGLYVFGELQTLYPETPASLVDKMNRLFANYQSSDGKPDKYQELGQYYRTRVVGANVSNDDFLKELHQKLEDGKPLAADLFQLKAPAVRASGRLALQSGPSVQAESEGGCPSGLSALATVAQAAGNFAGSIYPGVALIGGIVQAGCDMATPTDKRLDGIQAKLDEMAATLEQNNFDLAKLTAYTGSEGANDVLKDTVNKVSSANRNVSYYENIIDGHGSFMAFVDANKSFEKAWKNNPKQMEGFFSKFSEDWDALILVGQSTDKGSLTRAFGLLCNGDASANVNIVKNRKDCNAYILQYQNLVLGAYLKHMSMLKDVTATLNKYSGKEGAFIKKNVIMPAPLKETWSETYTAVMLPKIQAALNGVADGFAPANMAIADSKGAYFDLYAGLPTQFLDQFQTDGLKSTCTQGPRIGRQSKPVPNITNWVNDGKKSYVTVICRDAIGSSNKFTSNYYLDDGNDVVNLMGVLVGKNSPNTKTSRTFGVTDGIGGGRENAYIYFPTGNNWSVFSTDKSYKDYSGVITAGVEPNARITFKGETSTYDGPGKTRKINKYFTNYTGYSSNGGNTSKLYIRVTDPANGMSYAFAQYFWRGISSLRYSFGCLGLGCNFPDDYSVSFDHGPTLQELTGAGSSDASLMVSDWLVKN